MNVTGLLLPLALAPSILKYIKRTSKGSGTGTITPPTSEAGKRPKCKVGEKAIYVEYLDKYVCRLDFD